MLRLAFALCALLACAACSEPPQKELDRAQGAIDAARAAGADQYARESFSAATEALQQAHDAVDQRDYRLALSHALDASERAQEAARNAADGKAAARSRSESSLAAVTNALAQLQTRIHAAEAAKVPASALKPARAAAGDVAGAVQKARAALADGQYLAVTTGLDGVRERIDREIRAVDEQIEARQTRTPRRRSSKN